MSGDTVLIQDAMGEKVGKFIQLFATFIGGDIINVVFAVLTGSLSLGQASPCLSAFGAGQAAAYKMFETINRKPDIDSHSTNGQTLYDICGDIELRDVYWRSSLS